MSNNYDMFMREALKEAEKASKRGDYGIGAIVVMYDCIIGRAGNRVISSRDPRGHAELLAFDNIQIEKFLPRDYNRMKVFSTVSPCPMCYGDMLVRAVGEIIFGHYDKESSQHYFHSTPQMFRQMRPQITGLDGEISKECERIFLANRDSADRIYFELVSA